MMGCLDRPNSSAWRLLPPVGRRGIVDLLGHDIHKPYPIDLVDPPPAHLERFWNFG
jgi:hypothetical protein